MIIFQKLSKNAKKINFFFLFLSMCTTTWGSKLRIIINASDILSDIDSFDDMCSHQSEPINDKNSESFDMDLTKKSKYYSEEDCFSQKKTRKFMNKYISEKNFSLERTLKKYPKIHDFDSIPKNESNLFADFYYTETHELFDKKFKSEKQMGWNCLDLALNFDNHRNCLLDNGMFIDTRKYIDKYWFNHRQEKLFVDFIKSHEARNIRSYFCKILLSVSHVDKYRDFLAQEIASEITVNPTSKIFDDHIIEEQILRWKKLIDFCAQEENKYIATKELLQKKLKINKELENLLEIAKLMDENNPFKKKENFQNNLKNMINAQSQEEENSIQNQIKNLEEKHKKIKTMMTMAEEFFLSSCAEKSAYESYVRQYYMKNLGWGSFSSMDQTSCLDIFAHVFQYEIKIYVADNKNQKNLIKLIKTITPPLISHQPSHIFFNNEINHFLQLVPLKQ